MYCFLTQDYDISYAELGCVIPTAVYSSSFKLDLRHKQTVCAVWIVQKIKPSSPFPVIFISNRFAPLNYFFMYSIFWFVSPLQVGNIAGITFNGGIFLNIHNCYCFHWFAWLVSRYHLHTFLNLHACIGNMKTILINFIRRQKSLSAYFLCFRERINSKFLEHF